MDQDDQRQAALARFADQWSRSTQWNYSWRSQRPPAPSRQNNVSVYVAPSPDRVAMAAKVPSSADETNTVRPPTPATSTGTSRGRSHLDAAARWALLVFPGPIGELISREINVHLNFGFRFDGGGFIDHLASRVLATELPADPTLTASNLKRDLDDPLAASTAPGSGKGVVAR
jgi:hypothetical protein